MEAIGSIYSAFHRYTTTTTLLAKVAHIGDSSIYSSIVFSETAQPAELKFHMESLYVEWSKYVPKVNG